MKHQSSSIGIPCTSLLIAAIGTSCVLAGDDGRIGANSSRGRDEPSTYERVESEVDRGTGRIVDQQTYEIERIEDPPGEKPVREALEEERDREYRIDQRNREIQKEIELDRLNQPIEGQPIPEAHAGAEARLAPPTTREAQARAALVEQITRAVLDRDDRIEQIRSDTSITEQERGLQRVRVMYDFERRLREILDAYEVRGTTPAPTTRPSR